ncbi:Zn(II)2Cys6 transcription factor [Aspergillus saccharolyticus JOP 1030-1]|uniref:Zn(2)-C6 fungal-type domain-containing protein n=1 Tax=Aspergillus saccharolyticus JOP 1030-1 TaxID=1450539 RepID=A0A319AL86_9EURO|nr:hypothetical protein BP01DRAFT_335826 [Aspergillus saccharolyticus JOP 1030-1]PYH47362.1 hypothetical protein BP01DRAFT_335826 [Aspergillus saccharolyticus JOP 1030-1]
MRETQRVPRSCVQCTRRKVKCSKKIPCDACIRRGETAACMREVVKVHGRVTVAVDEEDSDQSESTINSRLAQENASLKTRIRQVESLLQRPELQKLGTDVFRSAPAVERSHSSEKILNDFQRLPFGLLAESSHDGPDTLRPRDDHVLLILPARHWSEVIVRFSLEHLAWVHCALEPFDFTEKHNAFWTQAVATGPHSSDHGWNAVYLSVLAVGVYFMNDDLIEGFQFSHESYLTGRAAGDRSLSRMTTQLCRVWCEASLRELEYADYTSKPRITTVQALTILNIIHKNLGQSSREYILHGLAVNTARLIGIDRLSEGCEIPPLLLRDTRTTTHLNVYRRLWWTLVIVDWMTVWSRPISIHPGSFTTVLDTSSDEPASPRSRDVGLPSPFEYHKAMAQLAATMQNTVRSIHEWSSSTVQASLEEIDSVASAFPPHLCYNQTTTTTTTTSGLFPDEVPSWVTVQRYLVWNLLDTWRINLCVALMPQLLDHNDDNPSSSPASSPAPTTQDSAVYASAVAAATRILQRRYRDPTPHFQKFWAVTCSAVSAGIFLCLDLICFGHRHSRAETAATQELIRVSIQLLEASSTETRHGALVVLRRLAQLQDTVHHQHSQAIGPRAFANMMKLLAAPRLWASVADPQSTLRFLFAGSGAASSNIRSGFTVEEVDGLSGVGDAAGAGGVEVLHDAGGGGGGGGAGAGQEDFEHYSTAPAVPDAYEFEDLFGASELVDMSLPWIDPATLMAFTGHVA